MALDDLIAEHLEKYHCGECRAVSSRELERVFDIRGPDLRRVINRLRGEGIPICSFDYGYYYAETEQELQRTMGWCMNVKLHLANPRIDGKPILSTKTIWKIFSLRNKAANEKRETII